MFPIVRVLATVSLAATVVRVSPIASSFRYSSDLDSARTKSHHDVCSHWPKRRSSLLVRNTSSRFAKNAVSSGGMPPCWAARATTRSTNPAGLEPGSHPNAGASGRPCVRSPRLSVAATRLFHTPSRFLANGVRRMLSGTW